MNSPRLTTTFHRFTEQTNNANPLLLLGCTLPDRSPLRPMDGAENHIEGKN